MPEIRHLLDVARLAAERAAAFIRSVPRPAPAAWDTKGASDFVTDVDRRAEGIIRDCVLAAFPESTVLGEELSPEVASSAPFLWVVDPLDGTANYLHAYPAYAVSIGLLLDGHLAVGVVLDIERDRLYHATAGGGAWLGTQRLQVSTVRDPAQALIGTGYPFKWPELLPAYLAQFSRILKTTAGIRRAGSAALDFVDVALGRFDGFWELMLAPWDVAAGALIVREAGGVVTDLAGSTDVVRHGAFVVGNPAIHEWLMRVLAE